MMTIKQLLVPYVELAIVYAVVYLIARALDLTGDITALVFAFSVLVLVFARVTRLEEAMLYQRRQALKTLRDYEAGETTRRRGRGEPW